MSRQDRPKQLLELFDGQSMLGMAAARIDGVIPTGNQFICGSSRCKEQVLKAIPSASEDRFLGEPMAMDTLNAVGLAAAVLSRQDPDAVFCMLSADQLIKPVDEFARRIQDGFALVEEDPKRIVTFSITPTHPSTGYGYVQVGEPVPGHEAAYEAASFREKPDTVTAELYLAEGTYGWNSGIFIFHAGTVMDALARLQPDTAEGLQKIAAAWSSQYRQDVLDEVYPTLHRTSVDFGLIEPAIEDEHLRVCVLPMDVEWVDMGSWHSFIQTMASDEQGNRTSSESVFLDSTGISVVSEDPSHLVAVLGCHDLVVVRTPDVTLICDAGSSEQVKELARRVPARFQ